MLFSGLKQFAVLESRPAQLVSRCHRVTIEVLTQGNRSSLIEEDLHSSGRQCAARGVRQNGASLREGDARKPLDELMDRDVVFQVLE